MSESAEKNDLEEHEKKDSGNRCHDRVISERQFRYDDYTARTLSEEALEVAKPNGKIACIHCPSLYQALRKIKPTTCSVALLESDRSFECFKDDFIFYDHNQPLDLPQETERAFDLVIVDPPLFSEETLCKTALTTRYIAKDKILLCTGVVMEEAATRLLDVHPTKFQPKTNQRLTSDFRFYTNYKPSLLNS